MQINPQKLKVLICDEDIRVLSRLGSWIEAIGEEYISTSDGIEAVSIFKSESPDIVLVSQELKNMGGIELIEKIKEKNPSQATILMLSDNESGIFRRAIELEVDKYLNKPIEAKPLFQAIESLSEEKVWHQEFKQQKRALEDYKDAINLTFSVSRHDVSGKVTYVNDLFCTTTGISYTDLMNGLLNPLCNDNEDMKVVWDALETDLVYRDRQVFKLDNNREFIMDITAVAILDENDQISEYLVFLDDVTKIIQSARKIKAQELDNRLDKLNHARELNKVKDSFLTIFTHELKTPLNSIINFSEYVAKHLNKETFSKKDRLVSQVKEINNSGHFMLEMIENLMQAMKLRDTNIKLNIEHVQLNTLLVEALSVANKNENLKIQKEDSIEVFIDTDASKMKDIFLHILSNAFKYAQTTIIIKIDMKEENFYFTVEDDGEGFKNTTHVFDLFEQDDADSMTREASGTGVGLYIVKQLCDKMSYKIKLLKSESLGGAKVVLSGKRDKES